MNRLIQFKKATPLCVILLVLACFELSPRAQAVTPAPDGGYPNENTAEGDDALFSLTTGSYNTAAGFDALYSNTTGISNTANGDSALYYNTTGSENTAIGLSALAFNVNGFGNTATGHGALAYNTSSENTANGWDALLSNTIGTFNAATGYAALYSNATGSQNNASGSAALFSNTTGFNNTANGFSALALNVNGFGNTAEGFRALLRNTGSNNIGLGANAGGSLTTGSGNVCIGSGVLGIAAESNTTRIRNVYSSVASGRAVYVNSDNKIGTLVSSRRFKDEIKPMDKASKAILALKPVTFRYKKEIEPNGAIMFGLIAEEVEKVDPDLVTRNEKGESEAVRYEAVNAMLLNEFLKEHKRGMEQGATITQQRKDFEAAIAQQQKQIEALTAALQKVSAQLAAASPSRGGLELNKPAPQTVLNDQ